MTAFEMADSSKWRPFTMAAYRNGSPSEWRADTLITVLQTIITDKLITFTWLYSMRKTIHFQ